MQRVYIAGPMRGLPYYNFPAFEAAEDVLRENFATFNPARRDQGEGLDPFSFPEDYDWNVVENFDLIATAKEDIEELMECSHIYMLRGWKNSKGAKAEFAIAEWLGLEIMYQEEQRETTNDILEEALALSSGPRQAEYGPPDQDFRRTADMWTALFERKFEPHEVAMAMVCLKLSRETHQEKRDSWVDIAGYARCGAICRGLN